MAAIALAESDEAARVGSPGQRAFAEVLSPAVIATEQLAYRTIAACWTMEHQPDAVSFSRTLFGSGSVSTYVRDLHRARGGRTWRNGVTRRLRGSAVSGRRDRRALVRRRLTRIAGRARGAWQLSADARAA